jgi:hypothetical protein
MVSREEELGAIVQLLDAPELLPRAAVLRGEAGIGKTTVWTCFVAGRELSEREWKDALPGRQYRAVCARP